MTVSDPTGEVEPPRRFRVQGHAVITILAHRGNTDGPDHASENRLPSVQAALSRGWGLETDIRRARDGQFYISHDPRESAEGFLADGICEAIRARPSATIALNIKEIGDEAALVDYLVTQDIIQQVFLFDMELIEPVAGRTAARYRELHPTVRIAARVSDRQEPGERALQIHVASVVWLDEFDGPWCAEGDIARLKAAGRRVYAVSPDLHGHSLQTARERWIRFCSWGVDGICTDYPSELESVLAAVNQGAER